MYHRSYKLLKNRSFFLFGARGVGKTTLVEGLFRGDSQVLWIDLLDEEMYRGLLLRPKTLETLVAHLDPGSWVVLDEVQKVPGLLNYVQRLIENRKLKFALTGSSARKLKRESANLLGGRASEYHLFPLSSFELAEEFNLQQALEFGLLPTVWGEPHIEAKKEYLRSYVSIYIRQEIKEEQVVRKLEPFLYFLEIAAQSNTGPINFTKIAKHAGVDHKAVERYYQILEDTLLGFFLPAFDRSVRAQQLQRKKFYFFDTGVSRAISKTLNVELAPSTSEFGRAFENFIILEILKINLYERKDFQLSYLRTKDNVEVDLIIQTPKGKTILIEVKSAETVDTDSMGPMLALSKSLRANELWIFSRENIVRSGTGWKVWPWQQGLKHIIEGLN